MNSHKIDFFISYEHKSRELESILLIKLELERRGYSVYINGLYESTFDNYRQFKKLKPKVAIVPAAYDYGILSCFAFNFVGLIDKVVNLQWEQVLTIKEEADLNGYHNPKGIASQVIHLCWGEKTKERLIKSGIAPSNAIVTGPIHLDLLRPQFEGFFISKEKLSVMFNLDLSKKWILFVSSFSFCSISDLQFQNIAESYGEEDTNYFKNFSLESKSKILDWFELLLNEKKDRLIIYRPHPDEINKDSRLIELENKYPNFRVISKYALKHWVKASDEIYNWYSTSMADIYFSNKPCKILRPVKIKPEQEVSIFTNAEFVTKYEDLTPKDDSLTNTTPLNNKIIEGYYDLKIDSKTCYNRICDILEEVYRNKSYSIHFPKRLRIKEFINNFKVPIGNYLFSRIPTNSTLRKFSFIRNRIESRERVTKWYKNSYSRSVAIEEEIKILESSLKAHLD